MRNSGNSVVIILIVIAITILSFSVWKSKTKVSDSSIFPSPTSVPGSVGKLIRKGTDSKEIVTYTDTEAKFSISYPAHLNVIETINEKYDTYLYKVIHLCENNLKVLYDCPAGGLEIAFNRDGLGGGCPEGLKLENGLTIEGKKIGYCLTDNSIRMIYLLGPSFEVGGYSFQSKFSESFTQEDAIKTLESFKVLKK